MSAVTTLTPPRVPFLDPRTGLISREWYKFFLYLFTVAGSGQSDISNVDLAVAPTPRIPISNAQIENASLMQKMARYDQAIVALQGAYMQPAQKPVVFQDIEPREKPHVEQYDPTSFCAPR